jgi:hypothetical protein
MWVGSEEIDQPFRVSVGQRSNEDRIYQAEDSGTSADAEGKCEHGGDGEPGIPAQSAQPIPRVLQKGIEPGKSALLAMSLSCLLRAAEMEQSLAAGFLVRQPGAYTVVGMERDVRFEFGREVVVTAAAE